MVNAFWLNNPEILFHKNTISKLWPTSDMTTDEKLNAITRLVIILTLIGFIFTKTWRVLITGTVTIIAIVVLRTISKNKNILSNFKKEGLEAFTNSEELTKSITSPNVYSQPSVSNPCMNVLPTDYIDNPQRRPAAPAFNSVIEKDINVNTAKMVVDKLKIPNVEEKLFRDIGDNFGFNQSMRQFYTTANSQIPNKQGAFAKWCYGDMSSCKEKHNPDNVDLHCAY